MSNLKKKRVFREHEMSFTIIDYAYRTFAILEKEGLGISDTEKINIFGRNNPTKEITETFGAIYHLFEYIKLYIFSNIRDDISLINFRNDSNILCICVGDGISPKSGYIFAKRTQWNIFSIDPEMKKSWVEKSHLPNLTCINKKIEDVDFITDDYHTIIIISIHSHANMNYIWNKFKELKARLICLSIPCCEWHGQRVTDKVPIVQLHEPGIFSEKNEIIIWTNNTDNPILPISDISF
jgi:hypothetical protein